MDIGQCLTIEIFTGPFGMHFFPFRCILPSIEKLPGAFVHYANSSSSSCFLPVLFVCTGSKAAGEALLPFHADPIQPVTERRKSPL